MKQEDSPLVFGTTVSRQRKITRPRGEMRGPVGEHATEASQPCLSGENRARISALEEAYGEYRL